MRPLACGNLREELQGLPLRLLHIDIGEPSVIPELGQLRLLLDVCLAEHDRGRDHLAAVEMNFGVQQHIVRTVGRYAYCISSPRSTARSCSAASRLRSRSLTCAIEQTIRHAPMIAADKTHVHLLNKSQTIGDHLVAATLDRATGERAVRMTVQLFETFTIPTDDERVVAGFGGDVARTKCSGRRLPAGL